MIRGARGPNVVGCGRHGHKRTARTAADRLSDAQMSAVMTAAATLHEVDRDPFLPNSTPER
jgi:hypothetical protein